MQKPAFAGLLSVFACGQAGAATAQALTRARSAQRRAQRGACCWVGGRYAFGPFGVFWVRSCGGLGPTGLEASRAGGWTE